jgi:hypothetical protein
MKKNNIIFFIMCAITYTQCMDSESEELIDVITVSDMNDRRNSIISIDDDSEQNNQQAESNDIKQLTLSEVVTFEVERVLYKPSDIERNMSNKVADLLSKKKRKQITRRDLCDQGLSSARAKLLVDALKKYDLTKVLFKVQN